ncbi:ABC transporter permease subunit [Paracoccus denitrificans]|uniref:ABC transporter permease subunit n=1 Tax=Paracoccus denitrificans TaxID=266 RepID=UPI001F1E8519|nr:ABC transporter permease subunit [Paracoccus denitrificans]
MARYVLGRTGQAVVVLWAAFTIAFVLLQLMPGDAVLIRFVGGDLGLSPEAVMRIREFYGADDPVPIRYLRTLAGFLTGDIGHSIHTGVPVLTEIRTNLPSTLWLGGLAFSAAIVGAGLIALAATLTPFRWLRGAFAALPGLMISIPVFWLGIVLIQVFSFKLGWPPHGARRPRLRRMQPGLALAWLVLAVVLAWALAPGLFTGFSGVTGVPGNQLKAPGGGHWLGTDEIGRDVLARIIHGARYSLSGAFIAVGTGLVFGTLIGVSAGSVGGRTDAVLMRVVDIMLAIPSLLLALSFIIILGFGHVQVALAVGITSIASFARLVRSEVVTVRRADYVEAAFGSGGRFWAVIWRHVLPNSLTTVLAYAALQLGWAVLQISTLGFLGYGAPPPPPEGGLLIAEGRNYMMTAWWLTVFPGLAVIATVLAANRIGRSVERAVR